MRVTAPNSRQFRHIMLACPPKIMQELLNLLEELSGSNQRPDAKMPQTEGFCYMFSSGAKLSWVAGSKYGIYCYSSGAEDGQAALSELKLAESLRSARRHFADMKKAQNSYPIQGKVQKLKFEVEWVYDTASNTAG